VNTSEARFRYHGTGGALFGLALTNALLTIITIGVYSFWAKNRIRDFHYSHTEMDGDRFGYHGTGAELLRGWLKLVGVMFVIGIVYSILMVLLGGTGSQPDPAMAGLLALGLQIVIWLLIGVAINGARRYRFSRSSFRHIRFSYTGEVLEFLGITVASYLLTGMTLGFYSAHASEMRREFLVNHVRYGTEPFKYDKNPGPLFRAWVKALLLTPFTIGLSWIWYSAFRHRHQWGNTTMRGGRFVSTVNGGDLLGLTLTNILLLIVTVGITAPWVLVRTMRYHVDNLTLVGTVDWASIQQHSVAAGASLAEGVVDSFDVDVGIGL